MKKMVESFYAKPLAVYLAAAVVIISCLTGTAEAMFLPVSMDDAALSEHHSIDRAHDIRKIQFLLESKQITQRLMDYGLSPEEALNKVNSMSDEQVHQFAANLDSVQAGGDVAGSIASLLIIALLVVLLIYLIEGRIEIKRR